MPSVAVQSSLSYDATIQINTAELINIDIYFGEQSLTVLKFCLSFSFFL